MNMKNEPPKVDDQAPDQGANTNNNQSELGASSDSENNGSLPPPTIDTIAGFHAESYAGFDSTIHAINADGTPKKKTDGSYALKRGRKAGTAANALPPKNAPQIDAAGEPAKTGPILISIKEAARQSANLVINAAVWICGEEIGKPQDKGEAEGLKFSFENYYEARGVPNIPPEIGLLIALSSYLVPRLMHEKTMPRMERIAIWIKQKLGG